MSSYDLSIDSIYKKFDDLPRQQNIQNEMHVPATSKNMHISHMVPLQSPKILRVYFILYGSGQTNKSHISLGLLHYSSSAFVQITILKKTSWAK